MMVQIIDLCDPNDQEKREDVWIDKLRTLYPEGLNMKRINQRSVLTELLNTYCCLILIISKDLNNKRCF